MRSDCEGRGVLAAQRLDEALARGQWSVDLWEAWAFTHPIGEGIDRWPGPCATCQPGLR